MSINRVVLMGNLTRDPELKTLPSGTSVLDMRLAFNTRRKNSSTGEWEEQPNYINANVFGARADALARYLQKGSRIMVDGRLRWREWETPGGEKRSAIDVVADEIEFADSKGSGGGPAASGGGDAPAPRSGDDLQGEDIPF